jgi:hypothetical protein
MRNRTVFKTKKYQTSLFLYKPRPMGSDISLLMSKDKEN